MKSWGHGEEREGEREAEHVLRAVLLFSWKSFLKRDGFWTSRDIPEMYSLVMLEMLPSLSLGISKMLK